MLFQLLLKSRVAYLVHNPTIQKMRFFHDILVALALVPGNLPSKENEISKPGNRLFPRMEKSQIVEIPKMKESFFHQNGHSFVLYEWLGKYLGTKDITNLNAVSKDFRVALNPLIEIGNLCKPETLYPDFFLKTAILSDECIDRLKSIFITNDHDDNGPSLIKFNSIKVRNWKLLAVGIPITEFVFDYFNLVNGPWDAMTVAFTGYRGGITVPFVSFEESFGGLFMNLFTRVFPATEMTSLTFTSCNFGGGHGDGYLSALGDYFEGQSSQTIEKLTLTNLEISSPQSWIYLLSHVANLKSLKKLVLKTEPEFHLWAKPTSHGYDHDDSLVPRLRGLELILSRVKSLQELEFSELPFASASSEIAFARIIKHGLSKATTLSRLTWNAPLAGRLYVEFAKAISVMENLQYLKVSSSGNAAYQSYGASDPYCRIFMESLAEMKNIRELNLEIKGISEPASMAVLVKSLSNMKKLSLVRLAGLQTSMHALLGSLGKLQGSTFSSLTLEFQVQGWPSRVDPGTFSLILKMMANCRVHLNFLQVSLGDSWYFEMEQVPEILMIAAGPESESESKIRNLKLGPILLLESSTSNDAIVDDKSLAETIGLCKNLQSLKLQFITKSRLTHRYGKAKGKGEADLGKAHMNRMADFIFKYASKSLLHLSLDLDYESFSYDVK